MNLQYYVLLFCGVFFCTVDSLCQVDVYEPNNTPDQAIAISMPFHQELTLCPNVDPVDWFNVSVPYDGHLEIETTYLDSPEGQILISVSQPTTNVTQESQRRYSFLELLKVNVTTGWYLVKILPYSPLNGTYELSISLKSGPTCSRDAMEPNDAIPIATKVPRGGATYNKLSLCSGDPDYDIDLFSITIDYDLTPILIQVKWTDDSIWTEVLVDIIASDGLTPVYTTTDFGENQTQTVHVTLNASQYYIVLSNYVKYEWDIPEYSMEVRWEPGIIPVDVISSPVDNSVSLGVGLGLGLGLPLILGAVVGVFILNHRKKAQRRAQLRSPSNSTDQIYEIPLSLKVFEIDYKQIKDMQPIGKGSFGMVYKAKWRQVLVAVKKLHEDLAVDCKAFDDFKSEAKLLSSLRPHPNVVLLLGITVPPGPLSIITEYCSGGSIEDILCSDAEISMEQQKKWCLGIAKGMLHLHEEGVIHRDLAVRNVLLTENWEPKVADFGLSRYTTDTSQSSKTVSVVGPLKWMPPEAIKDKVYSIHSDMWAYGVTVWEIVCRQEPWSDMDAVKAAMAVCYENLRLEIPQDCDPTLASLMTRSWLVDPSSRPTFKTVCEELSSEVPESLVVTNVDDYAVERAAEEESCHYKVITLPRFDTQSSV